MKHLQVGDECYVRHGKTGEIYAGVFGEFFPDRPCVYLHNKSKIILLYVDLRSGNRLVYPFPLHKGACCLK